MANMWSHSVLFLYGTITYTHRVIKAIILGCNFTVYLTSAVGGKFKMPYSCAARIQYAIFRVVSGCIDFMIFFMTFQSNYIP